MSEHTLQKQLKRLSSLNALAGLKIDELKFDRGLLSGLNGCGQGYYYSRPVEVKEFSAKFLHRNTA